MYLSFYHLKHKPFQVDTSPRFLWLGEKHKEAMATLKYGVIDKRGFLLLTGDVGTGKTTLLNGLLRTLDESILVAFIRDPGLEPLDFLVYTAHAFGMDAGAVTSKASFLIQFEKFLRHAEKNNLHLLLIIDEAQRMSQDLLEEVRLLSNMDKEEDKLLSIFFVGQIEFNEKLLLYENRALRQRIAISYNIETLSEDETREYIKHRLKLSASVNTADNHIASNYTKTSYPATTGNDVFSDDAYCTIYEFSRGYPRLINIICDRALLTGYLKEDAVVTQKHVEECVKELEIPYHKYRFSQSQQYKEHIAESVENIDRKGQGRRLESDAPRPAASASTSLNETTRKVFPQSKGHVGVMQELFGNLYQKLKSDMQVSVKKKTEEMDLSDIQSNISELWKKLEELIEDSEKKNK